MPFNNVKDVGKIAIPHATEGLYNNNKMSETLQYSTTQGPYKQLLDEIYGGFQWLPRPIVRLKNPK